MPLIPPVHHSAGTPATGSQPAAAMRVTVVESEACHFCEDALAALSGFAQDHEFALDVVDIRSQTGQALVQRHRPSLTPLVLVDGEFFSQGRLPRRKFAKLLTARGLDG
ncbi:glutaredoxin family protein [Nocardioides sp. XL1]|nr:glutaredoxin family protein [Nocardioides sp. XL1]ABL83283.1 glutaredoxin 2 [Nocardioides sp. JS614]